MKKNLCLGLIGGIFLVGELKGDKFENAFALQMTPDEKGNLLPHFRSTFPFMYSKKDSLELFRPSFAADKFVYIIPFSDLGSPQEAIESLSEQYESTLLLEEKNFDAEIKSKVGEKVVDVDFKEKSDDE